MNTESADGRRGETARPQDALSAELPDSPSRRLADSSASHTLIERVIAASARNKFLVFIFTIFAVAAGIYGAIHTPLDANPDLRGGPVIVYHDGERASPGL